MTEVSFHDDEGISVFALAAALVRSWRRIVLFAVVGAGLAGLSVISVQREWEASAAFIPQGGEMSRSGITSLASQLGFSLPVANPSASLDFYLSLLKSSPFLLQIVRDTMVVEERAGARVPFLELFDVKGDSPKAREEKGVETLRGMIGTRVTRTTGIVTLSARTEYPSVSLQIVTALVGGVNDFNLQTTRSQASAERRFLEARLEVAAAELTQAEDRLQQFLRANREYVGSPQLTFQHDRLRREVALRQEVYTRLAALSEEARAREVRDTPTITIFEPPYVPTQSAPRGRVKKVALGLIAGGAIGVVWVLISWFLRRRRQRGDDEFNDFMTALAQVRGQVFGRLPGGRVKQQT